MTTAYLVSRLVEQGLGIAMLPSAYVPQLTGVTTIEVVDAPTRVEYVIWSRDGRTPAATAFLDLLDIPAPIEEGRDRSLPTVTTPRRGR